MESLEAASGSAEGGGARATSPPLASPAAVSPTPAELVHLCAVDSILYGRTFFPRTFRQEAAPFHAAMWAALENPSIRLLNMRAFRGSAKTSILRTFISKRIAYGISRTILYVGASEKDAIRTMHWIRGNVERNHYWTSTFGLAQGEKWQETEIEIQHRLFSHSIWMLAVGMTGSVRGVNFDDYRPDLIVVDDPLTDENARTEEQRSKVTDLILGALRNSLTPASEEPNAKLALLATPQHPQDITSQALRSDMWTSLVFPCWTEETLGLPVDQQESSWPVRFPSEELRRVKRAHAAEGRLNIFAREMECRLVAEDRRPFRGAWLQRYVPGEVDLQGAFTVLAIDPVPPPSDVALRRGMQGRDFEAHVVWSRGSEGFYLRDLEVHRGHEPNWTLATAFRLARLYRVSRILVETVAYQKVLEWLLRKHMEQTGQWYTVVPVSAAGRQKYTRILNALQPLASNGRLWVPEQETAFSEQFEDFHPAIDHDDILDASAIALADLINGAFVVDADLASAQGLESIPNFRSAP